MTDEPSIISLTKMIKTLISKRYIGLLIDYSIQFLILMTFHPCAVLGDNSNTKLFFSVIMTMLMPHYNDDNDVYGHYHNDENNVFI